jgi:hypothetical protein
MTVSDRADQLTRETILKLLSDEENAKVSTAEGAASLPEGEEFVDLEHLDQGVQTATASMTKERAGHIVPRSAVHDVTWSKILAQLELSNPPRQ